MEVLGPSFLFAFSSFLLGDAWDEPGERHPPTCLRIAHLISYMEQSGWAAEMRDRAPVTMDWLDGHVATAIMVQPGYHGALTLELVNEGETPIALYPDFALHR